MRQCDPTGRPNLLLRVLCALSALSAFTSSALAELRLPAIFGDHMVMQQQARAPVWGWADPGQSVEIETDWLDATIQAEADARGRWKAIIPTPDASHEPRRLWVRAGDEEIALDDVLIGEVWVCSGQSNMEWPVRASDNAEAEIAAAGYPSIRFFQVANAFATEPQDDCRGQWTACSPETAAGFSAVGYFFGRHLLRELDVPIGLIDSTWGGTVAEAWTSEGGLRALGDFDGALDQLRTIGDGLEQRQEQNRLAWWDALAQRDPGTGRWNRPDFDDSDWGAVNAPGVLGGDFDGFDGVIWMRRSFELARAPGTDAKLSLGPIDDMDTVWINGQRVGGLERAGVWNTPRSYTVPADVLQAGANTIAVRIVDTGGAAGMAADETAALSLELRSGERIPLAGAWKVHSGAPMSALNRWPVSSPVNQNTPTALYNAMIAPLQPFAIRGAIWYQGESNRERPKQYRRLMPGLIKDWRAKWDRGDFPFYLVQIAPFNYGNDTGEIARLREAQAMTLSLPGTGMAATCDIGNVGDIHPRNKQEVGRRLALWAMAKDYGAAIEYCGPVFERAERTGRRMRIHFTHTTGGLMCNGPELSEFQIAGPDRVFRDATATIDGDTVLVSSPDVPEPVAVRFAFTATAEPNLYNGAGLPAPPFRTDDWDDGFKE
ncbi:MAG: sialate O-acetylesterase [Phycisphaerales bacterium JB039]